MTFILTRPVGNSGDEIINTPVDIVIPAGTSTNVDLCSCTQLSVKWIITLYNELEDKVHSAEILGMHRFQTNPKHTRYAKVGDKLSYDTDVNIVGGSFILIITNNEAFDLTASVTRIKTTNKEG